MPINTEIAEHIYNSAVQEHQELSSKAAIFYVLPVLDIRLDLIKSNFPKTALHTIAIKTCKHPDVLKHILNFGFGLEAASFEELLLAKAAGAKNSQIVFDSPAKTREEIIYCHNNLNGIYVNANSLEELERYPKDFNGVLGIRINPLVKNDAPDIFDVSSGTSKFGVPIDFTDQIVAACLDHTNVHVLHIHIGSHLKSFEANLEAINRIVVLAKQINAARDRAGIMTEIEILDIGGGLHFDLNGDFVIENFCARLNEIDSIDQFQIITEFGAYVHTSSAFATSKVEYVTPGPENQCHSVVLHIGADLFLRKIYSNLPIDYPYSVLRRSKREQLEVTYNIVGPLCFAGDILFERLQLQPIEEGDVFFIYDVGANTISMWSEHCSREKPPMIIVANLSAPNTEN